ncbi:MAG: NAD(P)-dependent glycerol-3-phosphate dehydrogenase [Spirochaetota bacterium]|nr:NAD(P)-dependent glycerol-3-phosphate dehydrogenase [Spirochaetota bacterium]
MARRILSRMKVAILGAGSWGTALGVLFANMHDVMLWEFNAEYAAKFERERRNRIFLPMAGFPENLHVTNNIEEAIASARIVLFAIPSHFLRGVVRKAAPYISHDQLLVSVVKGIETDTLLRMSEVIESELTSCRGVVALSGPTHAEEVARGIPAAIVAAAKKARDARLVQHYFMTPRFRIYSNSDLLGVELAAALKNVIAIAAGIADGLKYGDNTKAALMTRGLAEIRRLGVKMGARQETFSGLSGMGDLVVTCTSRYSRNRGVGMQLGQGRKLDDILRDMQQVAEGVVNTKSALLLGKKYHVELPIASAVGAVLFHGLRPAEMGDMLMTRSAKREFY